jgi:hypothetical protein
MSLADLILQALRVGRRLGPVRRLRQILCRGRTTPSARVYPVQILLPVLDPATLGNQGARIFSVSGV